MDGRRKTFIRSCTGRPRSADRASGRTQLAFRRGHHSAAAAAAAALVLPDPWDRFSSYTPVLDILFRFRAARRRRAQHFSTPGTDPARDVAPRTFLVPNYVFSI